MKPIYGYLRLLPGLDATTERRLIHQLADFAGAEGFTLTEVFVEQRWQHLTALTALTQRCQADGVNNIVVPSPEHLSTMPELCTLAQQDLQGAIGGVVWIAGNTTTQESPCSLTIPQDGGHP
ncbi:MULTISPECIES: hypothetical protein [unclassified Streptomyces]|uniref:Resolvase/invertase-type recombinase catalytic domain-containing protein n=1 Tax=Streptomyces sp. NBC_00060 TaxID=2975636 RepID=A0AAU2GX55_9ACTN